MYFGYNGLLELKHRMKTWKKIFIGFVKIDLIYLFLVSLINFYPYFITKMNKLYIKYLLKKFVYKGICFCYIQLSSIHEVFNSIFISMPYTYNYFGFINNALYRIKYNAHRKNIYILRQLSVNERCWTSCILEFDYIFWK